MPLPADKEQRIMDAIADKRFFRSHGERLNDLAPNIHPRKIRTLVFLPDYVNCGRKRAFHDKEQRIMDAIAELAQEVG